MVFFNNKAKIFRFESFTVEIITWLYRGTDYHRYFSFVVVTKSRPFLCHDLPSDFNQGNLTDTLIRNCLTFKRTGPPQVLVGFVFLNLKVYFCPLHPLTAFNSRLQISIFIQVGADICNNSRRNHISARDGEFYIISGISVLGINRHENIISSENVLPWRRIIL